MNKTKTAFQIAKYGCLLLMLALASPLLGSGSLNVTLNAPATMLDCIQFPDIELTPAHNGNPATSTYLWSGPGVNNSTQPTEIAFVAGTYSVTVTDSSNNCSGSATIQITGSTNVPDADAGPSGVLTCVQPTYTLSGSSTSSNVTFDWTGPGGFVSSSPNPTVSDAGSYELIVTDLSNGCSAESSVEVNEDVEAPVVNIATSGDITCFQPSVTIEAFSNLPNVSYLWIGPNGNFIGTNPIVNATENGFYQVEVTNLNNGCIGVNQTVVLEDIASPTISAGPDGIIDCNQPTYTFNPSSSVSNSTYQWTGPNNFTSTMSMPTVTAGGLYVLVVTDNTNGCSASDVAIVNESTTVPNADAGTDQVIICGISSATLGGSNTSMGPEYSYSWDDANGMNLGSSPTIVVPDAGVYTLTVSDVGNGCISSDVVEVTCSCINSLNITASPIPDGLYKAMTDVESASLVPANGVVTFQAGNQVKLQPGFKAEVNANFTAKIEICQ